jgi:biofilm PGA synthesis protein PgaD
MKNPLIIDRPDLQDWRQKAFFGALTATFWVIWFLLWLPLVTLLAWLFFGFQFQFQFIDREGYLGLLSLLSTYALVVLVMGGSLIIWAKYNHLRFRGVDRRKGFVEPTVIELAAHFRQPVAGIERWQGCAVMTVHHDEKGGIERVESASVPPVPGSQHAVEPNQ